MIGKRGDCKTSASEPQQKENKDEGEEGGKAGGKGGQHISEKEKKNPKGEKNAFLGTNLKKVKPWQKSTVCWFDEGWGISPDKEKRNTSVKAAQKGEIEAGKLGDFCTGRKGRDDRTWRFFVPKASSANRWENGAPAGARRDAGGER